MPVKLLPLLFCALFILPARAILPVQIDFQTAVFPGMEEQIITLIIKVVKTSPDEPEQFTLLKTIVGPGSLKKRNSPISGDRETYAFKLTDRQGRVLETIWMADPMRTRFEYVDERGTLTTITPGVRENVISVRSPYHPNLSFLEIESRSNARTRLLQSIPIQIN